MTHGGEEAAFRVVGVRGLRVRIECACCCRLRSVTSRSTATTSRPSPGRPLSAPTAGSAFDPYKFHDGLSVGVGGFAPDAELDRAWFAQCRGVAQGRQIGRTVSDMNAIEQAMALQLGNARAEQDRRPERRKSPRRRVRAGNHIGNVARQKSVSVLLGVEKPEISARQRFGAERQSRRIESRGDDAERGEPPAACGGRRQQLLLAKEHQQAGGAQSER